MGPSLDACLSEDAFWRVQVQTMKHPIFLVGTCIIDGSQRKESQIQYASHFVLQKQARRLGVCYSDQAHRAYPQLNYFKSSTTGTNYF